MKKALSIFFKAVLPLSLGIYLIALFFTSMNEESKEQFYSAIKEANYFWIFVSFVFSYIALLSRAQRWKYVLEPLGHKSPLKHRYHAIMIGYLVNLTIPRAGEVSRAAMLYRSDKIPFAKSFGTIVAERAVDLVMLGLVFGVTLLVGGSDFELIWNEMTARFSGSDSTTTTTGFSWKTLFLSIGATMFIAFIVLYFKSSKFKEKIQGFVKGVMGGIFAIFKSKNPGAYILHSFIIWGCYLAMLAVCFHALDETSSIPLKGMLITFIAGSIGMTVTNGGIGSYPLLVGLVVSFYLRTDYPDSAEGTGNALGMLIWVSQTILMIILGLVSLVLLPKNYSSKDVEIPESTR